MKRSFRSASKMLGRSGSRLRLTLLVCLDRKSTRLNSSHLVISYAVFCLKKKTQTDHDDHAAHHNVWSWRVVTTNRRYAGGSWDKDRIAFVYVWRPYNSVDQFYVLSWLPA